LNDYDVVIVGGGNAALTAAITCAENGRKALLLESAPLLERGGNTKYTRDIRYAHQEDKFTLGNYPKGELLQDLRSVSRGDIDEKIASLVINESEEIPSWMSAHGVIFKREIRGTISLSRTNAFFLGGGRALVNTYYRRAEKLGD
jgi:Succinate dehydrogenase/fumarate reductase, flavoprotein subunit